MVMQRTISIPQHNGTVIKVKTYGILLSGLLARQAGGARAWVSGADYKWAKQFNWALSDKGYASRKILRHEPIFGKKTHQYMHVAVYGRSIGKGQYFQPPKGLIVDHRTNVRTINARQSLKLVTASTNAHRALRKAGKSGVVGLQWRPDLQGYRAQTMIRGKRVSLGRFTVKKYGSKKAAFEAGRHALRVGLVKKRGQNAFTRQIIAVEQAHAKRTRGMKTRHVSKVGRRVAVRQHTVRNKWGKTHVVHRHMMKVGRRAA